MGAETESNTADACRILKAMSLEGRFEILCLLTQGEKSVLEIQEALLMRQGAVSQHLGPPNTSRRSIPLLVGQERMEVPHTLPILPTTWWIWTMRSSWMSNRRPRSGPLKRGPQGT